MVCSTALDETIMKILVYLKRALRDRLVRHREPFKIEEAKKIEDQAFV